MLRVLTAAATVAFLVPLLVWALETLARVGEALRVA